MAQRHFDQELAKLRERLLGMAGIIEAMIQASLGALRGGDRAPLEAIFQQEHASNQMHRELSETVVVLIARHQPVADDLRLLVASLNIVGHLERIGDLAVNLGRKVLDFTEEPAPLPFMERLARMSETVQAMVVRAVDAFVRQDVGLAEEVVRMDDGVDQARTAITHLVIEQIGPDRERTVQLIEALLAGRNLERMADHASSMAEDVIYLVQGRDVRHQVGESHERPGSWRQIRKIEQKD